MVVNQKGDFEYGYNAICEIDKTHADMFMDVGVIRLDAGRSYTNSANLERAILLMEGEVTFKWDGKEESVKRTSCFDENPICLHVPQGMEVVIEGLGESELIYEAIGNETMFDAKLYGQDDTVTDVFGKDQLGNTSIRSVRTIIDDSIAPYSNLVIGEVINHPGKWSSYPPHYHVQPEVYHYRFLPKNGFGVSIIGDEATTVKHGSTSMVTSDLVHPQTSAPGYAMYYVWMIPHTPKRWLKDRTFAVEHEWLTADDAKVWPYED